MTRLVDRTVLFADLRGSTALFESMGNAQATGLVTRSIKAVAQLVPICGGVLVKTLGDGLLATFERSDFALQCSLRMLETVEAMNAVPASPRFQHTMPRSVRLQVALASGELVELGGDCYGDAVNVAARLLDHAGDGEILVTQRVHEQLPDDLRPRLRHLDSIALRGRVEPVSVYVLGGRRTQDSGMTAFAEAPLADDPDGMRLSWRDQERVFDSPSLPVVLGRSPQAAFCVEDTRVSRSHARIDWHGGSFQLTDLSFNGTYVRFADGEIISLRRGSCTLHGHGRIGLGGSPAEPGSAIVSFEVIRFGDTQP
jgi:adenylate cyclase